MTVTRSREILSSDLLEDSSENMLEKRWGSTRHVKVYREQNVSLGISIVGGKVDLQTSGESSDSVMGIFVKNVVPDSPAGRTGEFKTGDRILEVSGVDIRRASHEKAIEAIKNASNPVIFVLQSLLPWATGKSKTSNEDVSRKSNAVPDASSSLHNSTQMDEKQGVSRSLSRKGTQYRKSVRYRDQLEDSVPGKIFETTNEEPLERKVGSSVKNKGIETKPSFRKHEKNEINEKLVNNTSVVEEPSKKMESSSTESDDEEDVREMEGRTVTDKGQEIDRASAGNVKRTKEEAAADPEEEDDFGYTTNKIRKKYANLGHTVVMVQLERSQQGLGLSLAGHKDRNCMAVFVCGLNPNGAAYRTGGIQVGDEILEVNGVVLHGRCHLNASAIIKGLSGPTFKVIILRRKAAIEDIAVRPITQFPVTLEEESPEEKYSNYPNVRTISIKKGTQSLGIMIIEGKHAEVGQGIFISDIQEGSAAEKAGLEIGEMILAVNKDSLLGSNYDAAANLLKHTEGIVNLVVSNPSKKPTTPQTETATPDAATTSSSKSNLKASAPSSRSPTPEPPADPATCPVTPGRDVTIEINAEGKALGLFFVGGTDTLINNAIVIVETYKEGAAAKDSRLQSGDQVLDINGTSLKDVTYMTASQALRQLLPKVKLIVYRPETIEYTIIEVDLIKKPGKGLGLSVTARENSKGIYVTDIISGGAADLDGRITKGDVMVSVNGQNVENSSAEEAGAILKTAMGKVSLKLHRYKPVSR